MPEIDHEGTDLPMCPHCGFEDVDWWDGLERSMRGGDKWDRNCSSCGRPYTVTMCVLTTFDTEEKRDA